MLNMAEENTSQMKEEVPELAPFDPTKKKKKKKKKKNVVIQDPADEVDKLAEKTKNLTVTESGEPSFAGMKKKKKKPVETDFLINDENGETREDVTDKQCLSCMKYIVCSLYFVKVVSKIFKMLYKEKILL
ncbi:eukaryotic translation initiation factor 2 subunit beta-like [Ananas comosus]|uniref:Eukaryotic translation initiation factor 2 subunit beta-like n=1 Tax=Ananas comosus TaxID=4615 RepID=A0A6P5EUX2_ANACO|nr:eukaryotic translation initiation factor 2 subunit beta-like [Ananas comosus]